MGPQSRPDQAVGKQGRWDCQHWPMESRAQSIQQVCKNTQYGSAPGGLRTLGGGGSHVCLDCIMRTIRLGSIQQGAALYDD